MLLNQEKILSEKSFAFSFSFSFKKLLLLFLIFCNMCDVLGFWSIKNFRMPKKVFVSQNKHLRGTLCPKKKWHRQAAFEMLDTSKSPLGIFKDVRFYPILNFGHFWPTLFSRCFYPIMNFRHFWAPPFFKMSGITPPEILAIFGPPSRRCPAGSVATQCPLSFVSFCTNKTTKKDTGGTNNMVRVFW